MLMKPKLLVILASVMIVAGCGLQQTVRYTNIAGYPNRYSDFDYKYAWKSTTTDHGVVIDGVMKNVRYPSISSLQLTVFVLGKDERIVTKETTFPMPQQTRENDVTHFSLLLRDIKPVPGDIFQFHVHYTGTEGGNNDGIDWISNFKTDAVTGAIIRPPSRNPDEW